MKAIWDLPFIQRALCNSVVAHCWQPLSPLYNAVLKHAVYRHGVRRDVGGGNRIRVCFENRRLRASDQYAREIEWLLAAISDGACVLDIGANIGLMSIIFGRKVGGGGGQYLRLNPARYHGPVCGRTSHSTNLAPSSTPNHLPLVIMMGNWNSSPMKMGSTPSTAPPVRPVHKSKRSSWMWSPSIRFTVSIG